MTKRPMQGTFFSEPTVIRREPRYLKTLEAPPQHTLELTKLRVLIPNSANSRQCLTLMSPYAAGTPAKTKEVHSLGLRTLKRSHSIDLSGVSLSANKTVDSMCLSRNLLQNFS